MNIPITQYIDLLKKYLWRQQGRVLLLAALLLGGIVLQLLNPQVIRYFIDTATGNIRGNLVAAALLFLLIVLLQRLAVVATTYVSKTVAWTATNNLRRDLTQHVLRLDMSFHNARTPGELLERIDGDVDRLANFFSQFVLQILGGALLAAGVLLLLFREDWRVGAVLAFFAVAYLAIHTWDQRWAAPEWLKERQYITEMSGFVEERVAGKLDIHTSGAIGYTLRRFYAQLQQRQWQAFKADVITDVAWALSKSFYELGTVAGMAMGAWLFLNGTISLGTVYLIIHYLSMLNPVLNRIARQMEDLQRVRVAIARVSELNSLAPKIQDEGERPMPEVPPAVRFDNVSFHYHEGTPVLCDVSFALPSGQVLGLLGRTGSGKTTISRLLFRLYDVAAGMVLLDGVDVRQIALADLRSHIGMVTQEVQLFGGSVRDNLTFFDGSISDERIIHGLTELGLDRWLERLPNGLNTQLAPDGAGLSAGEGQLLAMTRVFLKNPRLIILDEASSRLDPVTERLLERALDTLLRGRTAIIIAHRLRTVQRADQIVILENGHVKEAGAREALASDRSSAFAQLLQAGLLDLDEPAALPSSEMKGGAADGLPSKDEDIETVDQRTGEEVVA